MRLTRRLGLLVVMALVAIAMSVLSVGTATASVSPHSHGGGGSGGGSGGGGDDGGGSGGGGSGGGGSGGGGSGGGGSGSGGGIARLRVTGSCGDLLDMRLKQTGDPLTLDVTIPSADPSEVWTLTATEQDYDAVTGGRIGNPVNLVPTTLPALAFTTTEGGFDSTGTFPDTAGRTHGFTYTATRTSPTPITCTNQGFWTAPTGSQGPTADNPAGKPNTAPALTGATEADSGAHDVAVQFDQEMLSTLQGTPDVSRFAVTVDGVSRTVTGVVVSDDSPPFRAIVDVTFGGAALNNGQTVTLQYRQPLSSGDPALQDLDGLTTPSFGPLSIATF